MSQPQFRGDPSRRITVELPPTFEDLEHLCLTSFGMVGPVTLYKNGAASLGRDDYSNIRSGDNFVVVDSRGNAMDMKDFFVTTYDQDFTAKPLPPREKPAAAREWRKMPDGRDFRTTEDDYQAWPIEKREQPQSAARPPTLPFNGTTEHRAEYSPHKLPPRDAAPPPRQYEKLPDTRDFAPESSQFRQWDLPRRQQPEEVRRHETLPFNAKSSYQEDYVAHELPRRSAAEAQKWQPNSIPFNAQSTTASDFKQWDIPPRQMPHQVAKPPPSLPFNARSTSQDDYKAHQLPPRQAAPGPAEYRRMPDNRDFAPESSQFQAWDLPKRQQPEPVQRHETLPFNARSSYQDDYVPYAVQARPERPAPAKPPPSIPFNARSVSQDDFVPHEIPRKIYITLEPAQ